MRLKNKSNGLHPDFAIAFSPGTNWARGIWKDPIRTSPEAKLTAEQRIFGNSPLDLLSVRLRIEHRRQAFTYALRRLRLAEAFMECAAIMQRARPCATVLESDCPQLLQSNDRD
jgi:hypothetical protein